MVFLLRELDQQILVRFKAVRYVIRNEVKSNPCINLRWEQSIRVAGSFHLDNETIETKKCGCILKPSYRLIYGLTFRVHLCLNRRDRHQTSRYLLQQTIVHLCHPKALSPWLLARPRPWQGKLNLDHMTNRAGTRWCRRNRKILVKRNISVFSDWKPPVLDNRIRPIREHLLLQVEHLLQPKPIYEIMKID